MSRHPTETKRELRPIALTIAGSDSGGGAGIQADLKTFAALGLHGVSVITCITAQNPREVRGVQPIHPRIVRAQMEAVQAELPPNAVKTGMLYSAPLIREVAAFAQNLACPLIVDPVMVATSGALLLKSDAIASLKRDLLPLAAIVTPNLHEAQILTGLELSSPGDLEAAARRIHDLFGCAALVKGGHLKRTPLAIDVFFDGKQLLTFQSPFVKNVSTHGTGCTYSAAITGHVALGKTLPRAVAASKKFITRAINRSYLAGRHPVLRII